MKINKVTKPEEVSKMTKTDIEKSKLSIDVLNVIEENKIEVSISEMKQCVYLINKYIYNKQSDIEIKENYSKEVNRYHTEISI